MLTSNTDKAGWNICCNQMKQVLELVILALYSFLLRGQSLGSKICVYG